MNNRSWPPQKNYTELLENLVDYNDHHNAPFPNEKLWQAISKVMAEKEEEELNIILDANNMTMDTFFQSLTMTNSQEDIANVTIER